MAIATSGPRGLFPDRTFVAREFLPEAVIFQVTSNAGAIEGDVPAVRVPYVATDAPAGFVAEGAPISATDPTLAEVVVNTGKIAVLTRISREAASYQEASALLTTSVQRAVITKANTALLTNASAPTGLLNVAGIVDGGTLDSDNLDAISDAITQVEVNGGQATHIVCDPSSFGVLRAMKTASGSAMPLLGAPAEQTVKQLFGLPVVVTPAMGSGKLLVVDSTNIVSAVGAVNLSVSDDYYFDSDSRAVRVTWRIGWKAIRPNRLAKVAVTV